MGVRTIGALSQRLLKHGIDPMTPALLVERATFPDERRIFGTIADLPDKVAAAAPKGPCVVFIGETFDHAARLMRKDEVGAIYRDAKKPVFNVF
jgi:uroporphyrin-III C-methyltransferase / precorrin-2 dehydrogenase / sirohydrochlorin ferrochelatase